MSCGDCYSDKPSSKPAPDDGGSLLRRLFQVVVKFLPEGSALFSSSCCWLPVCYISVLLGSWMHILRCQTILDFLSAGSVAAASIDKLRNVFLAISILTLIWGVRREGLSRRMVWRVSICVGLLAWGKVNLWRKVGSNGQHSCH